MKFAVILVEPLYQGNVGAVARVMSNFGFKHLVLVNPCEIGEEALKRATHGKYILKSAEVLQDFDSVREKMNFLVATTGIRTDNLRKHVRNYHTPKELCQILEPQARREISIGLVFGRENYGLYNHELKRCDLVVSIPTEAHFPVLNLSQAVTIILYEIYNTILSKKTSPLKRGEEEIERNQKKEFFLSHLVEKFATVLQLVECPSHRKESTEVAFRRALGRALITEWEYHRLMGFLSLAEQKLRNEKKNSFLPK